MRKIKTEKSAKIKICFTKENGSFNLEQQWTAKIDTIKGIHLEKDTFIL